MRPNRYWIHALLLAATWFTTSGAGSWLASAFDANQPPDLLLTYGFFNASALAGGFAFASALILILMAHEMGHYLACRYYRVDASLPYFLPVPTPIGTMGAFIRIRSPILGNAALFDIGVAGPLAGFVVLLPVLAIGIAFSKVIPGAAAQGNVVFDAPLLLRAMEAAIFPGVPSSDIYLHPIARAAWVGMLATGLNLLPAGQLDGGHIVYAFFRRWHTALSRTVLAFLCLAAFAFDYYGWLVWAAILLVVGVRHPAIYDERSPGTGRAVLAVASLVIFVLCFSLTPVTLAGELL